MANQEAIDKGSAAKTFMDTEIYKVAVKELQDQIYADWKDVASSDTAKRENLFFLSRALIGIEAKLLAMVSNARIELDIAERQQKQVSTAQAVDE